MNQEKFDCIQEGRMQDALSSPEEISDILAKLELIITDMNVKPKQKRSISKNIWNRNIEEDFKSSEIVKRCIFACLRYYRTDQWKQEGFIGQDYQTLMQTPYENRFTNSGIENVYYTLVQWNMNSRGAKLLDKEVFRNNLLAAKSTIDKLLTYNFSDFADNQKKNEITDIVVELFDNLELTQNSKFVTLSKTLHFLLPQLMVPMDRTYTANYFHDFRQQDVPIEPKKQAEWNIGFHKTLCKVYMMHKDLIDCISIETKYPVTKLLDNMLIGFFMYRDMYIDKFSVSEIIR